MRRILVVCALALAAAVPWAEAAERHYVKTKKEKPRGEPREDTALVYVFRPQLLAGSRQTWVFIGDQLAMVSKGRAYSFVQVPEGTHSVWVHGVRDWFSPGEGSSALESFEGGRTYYFEIGLEMTPHPFLARFGADVRQIDEVGAEKLFATCGYAVPTEAGLRRVPEIVAGRLTEGLLLPFLTEDSGGTWRLGHADENDLLRVMEWIKPGEAIESWTEMVSVSTLRKAAVAGTVDEHLTAHQELLSGPCPGTSAEVLSRADDEVLYELRVRDCENAADEHIVGRVLEGTENRFVLHYAVRAPVSMTPERREEWIGKFSAAEILRSPGSP